MEKNPLENARKNQMKHKPLTPNETKDQIDGAQDIENNLVSKDSISETELQILNIRSEIQEYEETIKAIERGDKFSMPGKKVEDFHIKIEEAENQLRELENSKTNIKNKQSVETEDGVLLKNQEVPVLNEDNSSLIFDYKFGDTKATIKETFEVPEPSTTNETTPSNKVAETLEENLETSETIPQDFIEKLKTSEVLYANLEDKRNSFIIEYHKHLKEERSIGALAWLRAKLGIAKQKDEANLPETLNAARQIYDESKIIYAKELAAQLQESGASLAEISVEVYDKVILNEYSLRKQAEAELWTPKEKGVIKKSLDWYMRQNRFVRVGVSSAILTGAIVATGGLGAVAGSAVFAGRYIRGLVSITTGQLAGVGFDKVFKDRTGEKLEQSIEDQRKVASETMSMEYVSDQDDIQVLRDMEKRLEETYSKTEADKRKRLLAKSAVMLAATLGASAGLQQLEDLYQSNSPVKPILKPEAVSPIPAPSSESLPIELEITPTPEIIPTPEITPIIENENIDTGLAEEIPTVNPFEVSSTTVTISSDADNLWSAIKVKLQSEGLLPLLETSGQQTHMVDQVYNVFEKMTPEQLQAIGITSGNIQKVMTGSTIDLSAVFGKPELLESIFSGSTELEQQAIANIEAQGRVISAFQAANPKTLLTPDLIKQLVTKAGL